MVDTLVDELRRSPFTAEPQAMQVEVLSWQENDSCRQTELHTINVFAMASMRCKIGGTEKCSIRQVRSPSVGHFWHGVWTSSLDGTAAPHFMWNQLQTMRR